MKGTNAGASKVRRQGPFSGVAPSSAASPFALARADCASAARNVAGKPSTSAGSRKTSAYALVASSSWFE